MSDIIKAILFMAIIGTVAVLSLPWAVLGLKSYTALVEAIFENEVTG